jgi:hypothetical protein
MIIPNFIQQQPQTQWIHSCDCTSLQHRLQQQQHQQQYQFLKPSSLLLQRNHHLCGYSQFHHHYRFTKYSKSKLFYSTSPYISSATMSTVSIIDPTITTITSSSPSPTSSITTVPTFEPILNIPALFVFVFIMTMFVSLQYRIHLMNHAAEERNVALQNLRQLKVQQLSNTNSNNNNTLVSTSTSLQQQINDSLDQYEQSYIKFESLRTILPGVRILAPPSIHNNPTIQQEHDVMIQQYIKNATSVLLQNTEAVSSSSSSSTTTTNNNQVTYIVRNGIILFIAMTQILLLLFLISAPDPMNF